MVNKPTYEALELRVKELEKEAVKLRKVGEKLTQSEQKLRVQYKSMPIPTYTWQKVGEDFVLIDYNDAAKEITNGKIVDFLGTRLSKMYYDRPEILENFQHCFAKKTSVKQESVFRLYSTGESKYFVIHYAFVPPDLVLVHTEDIDARRRAEEALRESEEKYRSLFDTAPVGIGVATLDGKVLAVNQAMCQATGYTREEFDKTSVADMYYNPEQRTTILKRLETDGFIRDYEVELKRKDGTNYDAVKSIVPITLSGKTVLLTVSKDISTQKLTERVREKARHELELRVEERTAELVKTNERLKREVEERRQAQEELQSQKNKLESIMGAIPCGMTIRDLDYNLIYQNDEITSLFGNCIGEKCHRVFQGIDEVCAGCPVELAFRDGKPHTSVRRVETPSAETTFWENVAYPIRDANGKIISCLEINTNITDRKRADEALRQSEHKYRTLFEDSRDAIYMTTREGEFLDVNQSALDLFGYTVEEMRGLDVRKIYANPEDRGPFRQAIERHGSVRDYEMKFRKKDGTEIDCLVTATVRQDDDGSILGYQGIIHDVTLRKCLQAQLQRAQKMEAIGTMAGGIAHDFNNILMPIIVNTQMALMDIPDGSPAQRLLEKVVKAGNRAKDLVSQILTFSRRAEQEREPVKMSILIKETLKLLSSTLPSTIKINEQIQATSDTVIADPIQIDQILLNLCTNAAHAMQHEGGVLEVSLTDIYLDSEAAATQPDLREGPYVRLTVSDTGHGMDPAVMQQIFDPFFTTKTQGEGTGMGLSTVLGIVKSHGGAIIVHSKPHEGSAFHVYLPLSEIVVTDERPTSGPVLAGTEHILLVDDEEWVLTTVQLMLERLGYRVTGLTSSLEALEAFRAQPQQFDLVITDITMPDMTGEVLARQLNAIRPNISIILFTGYSERISKEKAEEIGIAAYIMKPVNIREMAKAVRKVLDKD